VEAPQVAPQVQLRSTGLQHQIRQKLLRLRLLEKCCCCSAVGVLGAAAEALLHHEQPVDGTVHTLLFSARSVPYGHPYGRPFRAGVQKQCGVAKAHSAKLAFFKPVMALCDSADDKYCLGLNQSQKRFAASQACCENELWEMILMAHLACQYCISNSNAGGKVIIAVCCSRTLSFIWRSREIVSLRTTCFGRFMSLPSGPFMAAEAGTRSRSCSHPGHHQGNISPPHHECFASTTRAELNLDMHAHGHTCCTINSTSDIGCVPCSMQNIKHQACILGTDCSFD